VEEDYLKQMANALKISNSIKFLNWIPNDDLPKYIASSDIYVSTSLSDGDLLQVLQKQWPVNCQL